MFTGTTFSNPSSLMQYDLLRFDVFKNLLLQWQGLITLVVSCLAIVVAFVLAKQNQHFLEKQQKRNELLVKYQVALACCNSQMQTLVLAIANNPTKEIWKAFEDACIASDKLISTMKKDFPEYTI